MPQSRHPPIYKTDEHPQISPTSQPPDQELPQPTISERSTIVSSAATPHDETISQDAISVASDCKHVQEKAPFSEEVARDLLPVDKEALDAIQKEIAKPGAKPKAQKLDHASPVERAVDSNVASPTTCADPNAVSDKSPSAEKRADATLVSLVDASAAAGTNTHVGVEAAKGRSEVRREINAAPTGRSRPAEKSPSTRAESLPIDNPDALGEMSAVISPARDTGEDRLVAHSRAEDGNPIKLEVSDSTNPIRRKEPTEASDEILSASNDATSTKWKGLASTEVIASTPLSRPNDSAMQINAETRSDVSVVSRHAAPSQHAVAEARQFEGWQNARMLDRAGQAEMKLGIETAAFGSVRIHTVVRDSQVGLTISGERGNLSPLIAAEMPGVEARLREQDLRIDTVRVYETTIGSSTSGGSQGDTRDRPASTIPSRGVANVGSSDPAFDSLTMMSAENSPGRVNIRV